MNNTKRTATIILAVILFIALCVAGFVESIDLFLGGCFWWECAPSRSFDVLNLGLPSGFFPANARISPISLDDDDNPETYRTGYQEFVWGYSYHGGGNYTVEMYSSARNSSANFTGHKKSFFSDWGDTKILWAKPQELTYVSPLADQFYIACGKIDLLMEYRCGAIAQYQEFLLFLNITLSDGMTSERFQEIVIYMDRQISSYLYKK